MRLSSLPTVQTFKIEDEEYGDCQITVRQATTGDVRERNALFSESSWIIKDPTLGEQEIKSKWNPAELAQFDAYKTLIDADIVAEKKDEEGNVIEEKPWFEFEGTGSTRKAKAKALFFRAWDNLPPRISAKIYQKILLVNPQFGGAPSEGESSAT